MANNITTFPNYYTNFVQPNGKIDDAWFRSLTKFREQVGGGFTVVGSTGLLVEGSPIGPGDTLTLTNTGVTSIVQNQPAQGIAISGSGTNETGAVSYSFSLANDLAGVEGLTTYGLAIRTAADTWNTRTITGTVDNITIVNGDGVAGNPTVSISSTYPGQTSITTLGEITTVGNISSPPSIQFNTTTALSTVPGMLTWDDADGTLSLGLKGGNVTLQLGQEMVMRGYNRTGSTILNGTVVYVLGAHAGELEVAVASNASYATSQSTIGMATEDIPNNGDAFFTTHGEVHDLNTSAFAEGDELWLGTAGAVTNVRPTAPTQKVVIGYCVRSHPTQGIIFVKPAPAGDLTDLSDVLGTAPANGQALTWISANSRWEPSTPTGGTVTSVGLTVPSFLSVTGSPVTGAGTLAVSYSGTALPVLNGGTGTTTSTGSGSVVLSTSPVLTTPNIGVASGTSVSVSGNITSTAGVFSGNGSSLTSLTGANVTGTVPLASVASTVSGAAQANITSVGTLTSLAVTGNITSLGRIGVGTATPNTNVLLNLVASGNTGASSMRLNNSVDTSYAQIQFVGNAFATSSRQNNMEFLTNGSTSDITFLPAGTEKIRIGATNGHLLMTGATSALGYGTGSGGAVTQATSRTTGVTLNKAAGAITLVSAAGTPTWQSFTVTNSVVAATDTVIVNQKSGTDKYIISVTAVAAGSFQISFATTGGLTTEQPVFNFAVIKAVTA